MNPLSDLRFAVRTALKSPGLVLAGVVALALGIGANTAVFSVADAVLFKPLSLPDARGVVVALETQPGRPDVTFGVSTADYFDWKSQSHAFEGMAAYQFWSMNITSGGFPESVQTIHVSGKFFPLLHAQAALGRTFATGEDQPGREREVVLSNALWERRFAADRGIVGRTIRLNLMDYTVVGVMPKEFEFPMAAELWCPLALDARQKNSRDDHALMVLGRLRPGASIHQGEAELQTVAKRLAAAYPDTNHGWGATLRTVRDWLSGYQTRAGVIMVLVAVGFVLLIACANVTNVLLARSVSRQKEIALRTALGASRWRIIRQLLAESMLLSGAGSALGLVLAQWELSLIVSHMPASVVKYIPWWRNISLDWRALLFTAGVALFAGVAAGLLPALQSSRPDLNTALKEAARNTSARPRRLRSLLLAGEIALSLTLLIGAALTARGFGALKAVPGDHQPETMLTVQFSLPYSRYPDGARIAQFQSRLLSSLAEIPGARDAAVTNMVPYAHSGAPQVFTAEGQAPARSAELSAFRVSVSPGLLRLMRVPLRTGRFLTEADSQLAPRVAVVSEALARRCWPGQNPIGKQVRFGRADSREPWMTVAGVAGDIRWNWFDPGAASTLYVPYAQNPEATTYVALRTADPGNLIPAVRARVAALDPELPIGPQALDQTVHDSLIQISYMAAMMSFLGLMALVLASVGVYGMMSFSVTERTREIGIRMALGAETRTVVRMLLRRGAVIAAGGLAIGLLLSLALARSLASLIWGINALDVGTFAGVSALLLAVALVASWVPARRASRVDPLISLRHE